MAAEKVMTLTWRDENYGRVYDAQSFRWEKEPWPSETEVTKLGRLFRKNGFDFHVGRCCWMAEYKPADTCVQLVEALEAAGYTVENRGAVPDALASRPAMTM
jgi:hypothetical protein